MNLSDRLARAARDRPLVVAASLVAIVKIAWLIVDHRPLFFLGDSHAYVNAAVDHWVPLERSFVYPLLIRAFAELPRSIRALVLVQSFAGGITAWLVAYLLVVHLRVNHWVGIIASVCLAMEPGQLLYERMILTEAFALLAFAVHIVLGVMYVSRPQLRTLVAVCIVGIVAVSLRTVYIPVVIVDALALPAVAWFRLDTFRRRAGHVAVAIAATLVCHMGYRQWMASLTGLPPAYQYQDGFFLLCAWAPVVEPVDADDPRLATAISHMAAARDTMPWGVYGRDALRWQKGFLIDEIVTSYGDERAANLASRSAAMHALRRNPIGTLLLAPSLYADYWRIIGSGLDGIITSEEGSDREIPPELADRMATLFGLLDAARTPAEMTPVKRYHFAFRWIVGLYLVSVFLCAAAVLVCRREVRAPALFVLFVFASLLGTTTLFSTSPVFRYLHPFALASVVALAVLIDRAVFTVRQDREPAPVG